MLSALDLGGFEHTSARKLRGLFQTMRLRLLWTQRWPADCRGAGLSGRFKGFSRRCRSRSFSADYRRKKYDSQQSFWPMLQREMVHLDKQRPRNHSHFCSPVTLSEAPPECISVVDHWREVEGPRQSIPCHAASGSSLGNNLVWHSRPRLWLDKNLSAEKICVPLDDQRR